MRDVPGVRGLVSAARLLAALIDWTAARTKIDAQFIRYVLVGCMNTAVGYGLFALCILIGLPSPVSLAISTVIGVMFNYFSTGRLVFAWRDLRRLGLFVLGYALNYGLNAAALLELERMGISPLLAQAMLLPVFVLLAFIFNKFVVFRRRQAL